MEYLQFGDHEELLIEDEYKDTKIRLSAWGLKHLIPIFVENKITPYCLRHMKESQVAQLCPTVGDQVVFSLNRDMWVASLEECEPKPIFDLDCQSFSSDNLLLEKGTSRPLSSRPCHSGADAPSQLVDSLKSPDQSKHFRKHLSRDHEGDAVVSHTDSSESFHFHEPTSPITTNTTNIDWGSEKTGILFFENALASLISSLYSDPSVPPNSVQSLMMNLEQFMDTYHFNLINHVHSLALSLLTPSQIANALQGYFLTANLKIADFNSEFKRLKYFEKLGSFIPPEEIQFATKYEMRDFKLVNDPVTMQVVPIGKVLKKILSYDHIFKEILDYGNYLEKFSEPMVNIVQGQVWKNKSFTNSNSAKVFQYILYLDEFEVDNSLGSHASIQKLGGIYLSLPFLPPKLYSKLQAILLLAIFHSSDRSTYGNQVLFQYVINQLNELSREGIQVENSFFSGNIKFQIATLTGDNLGLNGILGFVQSFNSNYCCRICSANKSDIQNLFVENMSLLRTKESYQKDLLINDVSLTGIKEKCVWLELEGFSLFENVAVDTLHDYLEGCCRYVMKSLVKYLVQDAKFVTYSILKSKIVAFDYGPDSSSTPANALTVESSKINLKTSGSEMFILVRYFGLIAGTYVPVEDKMWEVYLLLRQLLEKLFSKRIYKSDIIQLEDLIEYFLSSYVKQFKDTLKPEFHFLTHYPRMLEKFGPLGQLSTIQFESSHQVSKVAARDAISRINVCKTVVMRNQLTLNELFLHGFSFKNIDFGIKTKISPEETVFLKENNIDSSCSSVKYFVKDGIRLDISSIITWDLCLESGNPCLGKILAIYVDDVAEKNIFLKCAHLPCLDFEHHYYAYEIQISPPEVNFFLIPYQKLFSAIPNTLTILSCGEKYVTLRHQV